MAKRILFISCLLLILSSCAVSTNLPSSSSNIVSERTIDTPNVQFLQGQVLPPYGVKVTAEVVAFQMRISTSKKETGERNQDLQNAVDRITALAAESKTLTLKDVSVTQISNGYAREISSPAKFDYMDTASVNIALATNLSQHDQSIMKAIARFNEFLEALDLPATIAIQALSIEPELGDLEGYRAEMIERVYQELERVKEDYGPGVKFEITGLYDPIKKMQLSDTEYYIYLEPIVKVLEF